MRADRRRGLLAVLAVALVAVGGCTEIENAMASVEILNFMREAPFFDPYEAPRPAPPRSVPLESPAGKWEPPVEQSEAAIRAWGDTMSNPLSMTDAVLERGAYTFQTNCAVCHGVGAQGDGPIVGAGKLPFATNLTLPTTVERTDGYIYALIRVGRGLMPSYQRIPPRDRWAVVNYVRHLQEGGEPIRVNLPGNVQPGIDQLNTTAGSADSEAGQE
jgi:mono/diheme cytochrome c family protein